MIVESNLTKGTITFNCGSDTRRAMQQALYDAYRCAWKSITPLWCELDRVLIDERIFPEFDLFNFETDEQRCTYLDGLMSKINEMLRDLGVPARASAHGLAGHYISCPAEQWPRSEIEQWLAFQIDRSQSYPWK